jgi:flagellar biosynthesis anti-sigma factor FlgM
MRIGLNPPDPQGISTEKTATSPAGVRQASNASLEDTDAFSSDTVTLSTLASRAMQTPEVRQDQVASLQQSIATGQYTIDPQGIAAAILGY